MSGLTQKVKELVGLVRHTIGEVGLEIELEGHNLPKDPTEYWVAHEDGSLRGESVEYVLNQPIPRLLVSEVLQELNERLKNSTVVPSHRCSVHVHINAQELTAKEVFKWLTVYCCVEQILLEFCGDSRKGNLFCLSLRDSQFLVDTLRKSIESVNPLYGLTCRENMRYAACNTQPLARFGSLEFRALFGTTNQEIIETWCDALLYLKDYALSELFETPIDILQRASVLGPKAFYQECLPKAFLEKLPRDFDASRAIRDGIWLAQEFVFASDWKEPIVTPKKKKPTTTATPQTIFDAARATGRREQEQLVTQAEVEQTLARMIADTETTTTPINRTWSQILAEPPAPPIFNPFPPDNLPFITEDVDEDENLFDDF